MTELRSRTSEVNCGHMTPERWQLVKEKLDLVLNLEGPQRAAFLGEIENADPSLRQELDSLLASNQALTDFMETPPLEWVASRPDPQAPNAMIGRRIGAYQIIEQIGAGGMGEVYRAFRADDQYRKEVAIKLVRAGHASAVCPESIQARTADSGQPRPSKYSSPARWGFDGRGSSILCHGIDRWSAYR